MSFFLGWPPAVTRWLPLTDWQLTLRMASHPAVCKSNRDRATERLFQNSFCWQAQLEWTGAESKHVILCQRHEDLIHRSDPCGVPHNSVVIFTTLHYIPMKQVAAWRGDDCRKNPERKDDKLKSGGHSLIYCHKNDFKGKFNTIWF